MSVPLTGVILGGETSLLHVAAAICQELMETWSFGRFCLVGLSTHVVLKDGTNWVPATICKCACGFMMNCCLLVCARAVDPSVVVAACTCSREMGGGKAKDPDPFRTFLVHVRAD